MNKSGVVHCCRPPVQLCLSLFPFVHFPVMSVMRALYKIWAVSLCPELGTELL